MKSGWLKLVAALAAFALFTTMAPAPGFAEADQTATPQPMLLPVDPSPLVISTQSGPRSFTIEIAKNAAERSAGLMYRHSMPDERGMLFIYEKTQDVAFWMKNTPMPLDLLFISEDGRLVSILAGEPYSLAPIAPPEAVRYVLELKAGTAKKTGVAVGDQITHPQISGR
ncbi:DUF192 domain-containing protein [Aquamicrobium segne]|uniref:DUF192 domain-containing protein n=1 Tax=Aquamicrobium segne TaxID=469547 RepID=A0ABW0GS66_9HYPH